MKSNRRDLSISVLTMAVRGALATMAAVVAMPQAALADGDPGAAALINPDNYVEIGGIFTSQDSSKFGEYNGLDKKGGHVLGNFSVSGGDSYAEKPGIDRWSIYGNNLGTDSRQVGAAVSAQDKWSFSIDYDELRHNITDSYRTPYQSSLGGNTFTLPSNFGTIDPNGTASLTANQLAAYHQMDVYSKRQNTSISAGYNFNREWNLKFDYKHIEQTGSKLISSASDSISDGLGENVAMLLTPTEYQTDNFNLAVNWGSDKGFFSAGYYGSLFHDDYNHLTWDNPFLNVNTNAGSSPESMSTPPSNQFHQLNFSGGYFFTPATRLVGGLSYARNTQNESYAGTYTPGLATPPISSLNAAVIMKHADLKLSNQTTQKLNLSAGFTYNERDNNTASAIYPFQTIGGDSPTPVNIPLSWKHTQAELAGSYRLDDRQHLHAAYNYDKFERWCNTSPALYAAGGSQPVNGGTYPTPTSCAQVPKQVDNILSLDYRLMATDTVNFNAGYAYSKRNSDVNPYFYNPMQSFDEGFENMGFLAFFQASRKENRVRMGVDWQATEKFDLSLSGKYTQDDYDATLGVQQGKSSSINLDATYAYSEKATVSAYATVQRRTRDLTNGQGQYPLQPLTALWTNNLTDNELTLGLSAKQKGLMGERLDLAEGITYSLGKTDYSTAAGANYTCVDSTTCGVFPTIKNEMISFRISGGYKIDKASKVMVGYQYQHLTSNDPTQYDYYQYGYSATVLPAYLQAPSYNQNLVYAAYRYDMK